MYPLSKILRTAQFANFALYTEITTHEYKHAAPKKGNVKQSISLKKQNSALVPEE